MASPMREHIKTFNLVFEAKVYYRTQVYSTGLERRVPQLSGINCLHARPTLFPYILTRL